MPWSPTVSARFMLRGAVVDEATPCVGLQDITSDLIACGDEQPPDASPRQDGSCASLLSHLHTLHSPKVSEQSQVPKRDLSEANTS